MDVLEMITDQYISRTTDTKLIRFYHTQLIRRPTKLDRVMVLRIIDEKDKLIGKAAMENYQRGFAMGMALAANTAAPLHVPTNPQAHMGPDQQTAAYSVEI